MEISNQKSIFDNSFYKIDIVTELYRVNLTDIHVFFLSDFRYCKWIKTIMASVVVYFMLSILAFFSCATIFVVISSKYQHSFPISFQFDQSKDRKSVETMETQVAVKNC